MEQVRLAIKTKDTLSVSLLENLQGDLKTLSNENYEKLKREILADGFSFAVHVWENPVDGKVYITDGHQRVATLKKMSEEGYKIPQVPVVFIEADNINHAKKKVLAAASQYGEFNQHGANQFIGSIEGLDASFMENHFSMPDIDFGAIEFAVNERVVNVKSHDRVVALHGDDNNRESEFDKTKLNSFIICPHCNEMFDKSEAIAVRDVSND